MCQPPALTVPLMGAGMRNGEAQSHASLAASLIGCPVWLEGPWSADHILGPGLKEQEPSSMFVTNIPGRKVRLRQEPSEGQLDLQDSYREMWLRRWEAWAGDESGCHKVMRFGSIVIKHKTKKQTNKNKPKLPISKLESVKGTGAMFKQRL